MSDIHISAYGDNPHGGFWRRVGAALIDTLVIMIPWAPIAIAGGILDIWATDFEALSANPELARMPLWTAIAGFVLVALYKVGFEASPMRATPGKLVLGLRVIGKAGNRLSPAAGFIRSWPWWTASLAAIIDTMARTGQAMSWFIAFASAISFLTVAFTAHKQGFHDIMAKAFVVKKARKFSSLDTHS